MTGSVRTFERGIALIVEGATEKMFYQVYLERCCDACPPAHMDKELLDGGCVLRDSRLLTRRAARHVS